LREWLGRGWARSWEASQLVVATTITWLTLRGDGEPSPAFALPCDPVLTELRRLYLQVLAWHQGVVLTSNGIEWLIAW
jgi:hypothetical protein